MKPHINTRSIFSMKFPILILFPVGIALSAPVPEEIVPSSKSLFIQPKTGRAELQKSIRDYMAMSPGKFGAHPAAADFPGAVESKVRVTRSVTYAPNLIHRWDTNAPNSPNLATGPDAWQETGLYAAPGEVVIVNAAKLPPDRTVSIVIGCHRDSLFKLEKWSRFPLITRSFELKAGRNEVANAFGGQLFIQIRAKNRNAKNVAATGQLEFANAVEAPTFVIGKDTRDSWAKSRLAPDPWGTLVGNYAIMHVQTSELRKLDDPAPLIEWWDKALALEDDLVALVRLAPERIVPDRQIAGGFMHSGYPFMCILRASQKDIIDLPNLAANGKWGFFHELGHNHQRREWTFDGQGEVTCNFFSLYVMEKLVGKPPEQAFRGLGNLDRLIARRFATPPNMGPFEQLASFVVLIKAHGWEPLRETLRSYAAKGIPAESGNDVATLQSVFVERYGIAAKANVADYFTLMGYKVSDACRTALKDYPVFKPVLPVPAK